MTIVCRLCKARLSTAPKAQLKSAGFRTSTKRVLMTEDLAKALQEVGILGHSSRIDIHASSPLVCSLESRLDAPRTLLMHRLQHKSSSE